MLSKFLKGGVSGHIGTGGADLLPTTAGLQLGQHLQPEVMHALLQDAAEWARLTPERVSVMLAEKVNRLKHDRYKRYVQNIAHS